MNVILTYKIKNVFQAQINDVLNVFSILQVSSRDVHSGAVSYR
jgi:hypothetical protein